LTVEDFRTNTWGLERAKQHNDWDGVDELLKLPDDSLHRNVDKIIIAAGQKAPDSVKVAIVCPPTIYGPGRGPGNQKSVQAYWLAAAVLKRKKGFLVGEGKNVWHQVHVQDLSDLFFRLGEAAAAGGGDATWNDKGYYLAENGPFVWGDIQRVVAKTAYEKKLIPSPEVESISDAQVTELNEFGLYAWGSSSRGTSYRAKKLLGWSPKQPSLLDHIPSIVDIEAKELGLA
jgi:nucleoside-diphosphate-sugar epimerase